MGSGLELLQLMIKMKESLTPLLHANNNYTHIDTNSIHDSGTLEVV